MARMANWLKENSDVLQGLAALLGILATLVAGIAFLPRFLRPDLLVFVDTETNTTPKEVVEWARGAARYLRKQPTQEPSPTARDLATAKTAQKLEEWYHDFERVNLQVRNQSNRELEGIRLRVDNIGSLWSAGVSGPFLTDAEASSFLNKVPGARDEGLTLPPLPSIPPKSYIEVSLQVSQARFAQVNATAEGVSIEVKPVIELPSSWVLENYRDPSLLIFFTISLIVPLGLIFTFFYSLVRARIVRRSAPTVLYNVACKAAVAGDTDDAFVLLRAAFRIGYTDKAHARRNPDLERLRQRNDFKELTND